MYAYWSGSVFVYIGRFEVRACVCGACVCVVRVCVVRVCVVRVFVWSVCLCGAVFVWRVCQSTVQTL